VLAIEAQNKNITTIEGLSDGIDLHPVQQAFVNNDAAQCGYCTPGFIMSAKALLDTNPSPTRDEVRRALSGDREAFSLLKLQMKYDDGFVAWINGAEVARSGLNGDRPNKLANALPPTIYGVPQN